MGTLAYSESKGGILLQQELAVLKRLLSPLVVTLDSALAVRPLHSQLANIVLSADYDRMAQAGDNAGIMDIKKNLQRLYEMLSISVMDNREMAREVKSMGETVSYTSLQINNHDSRIDDNESNLREIMGKVDRIQEDLQRFITMNQSSRVNGATVDAMQPMEEESIVQPRKIRGNP